MKVLSVFNQKGGVGKTTATINIGAALALMLSYEAPANVEPDRVLLVDLDKQGHSQTTITGGFFRRRIERTDLGPYDNIAGLLTQATDRPVLDIITNAGIPIRSRDNMDFVPSSKARMMGVDAELKSKVDGIFRLQEILFPIANLYEYVVLDNPPDLNSVSINALVAATHVVIPVQLAGPSLEALTETRKSIDAVRRQHNPDLQLVGILPTMAKLERAAQRELLAALEKQYGDLLLPPIADRSEVESATNEGMDIFSFKPSRQSDRIESVNKAANEYGIVAREIRRRMDE